MMAELDSDAKRCFVLANDEAEFGKKAICYELAALRAAVGTISERLSFAAAQVADTVERHGEITKDYINPTGREELNAELVTACKAAWEWIGTFNTLSSTGREIEILLHDAIAKAKKQER